MEKGDTDRKLSAPSLSSSIPSERTEVTSEEVRTFRLGGIGSVSNSIGRLGCDRDTMPPESQKRNRTYHAVQTEPQQSGRGQTGQGAGYLHFQPARRNTTFISHPPLRPTVQHTVENQRKVRNSTSTMDYLPSHDNFCTPDFLKSSFSPSPSSMYMYEQDRQDLHTSLHDTAKPMLSQMCATQDLTPLPPTEPEFDLNPQFENSNNLERFFGGALGMTAGRFMETNSGFQSSPLKRELMTSSPQEMKPAPAATEVNIDPYLFGEDSDNVFSEGRKVLQTGSMSAGHRMAEDAKKDVSLPIHSDMGPKTFTPLRTVKTNQSPAAIVRMLQQQSQSSPSHTSSTSLSDLLTKTRTQKMAMGSTIPTTSTTTIPTTIKIEPAETDRSSKDSAPSLPKILTSPSQNAPHMRPSTTQPPSLSSGRVVMPVAGQSRRPTLGQQGKSGSVEEKWKEIEKFIHDPNSDQPHPSTSSYIDRKRKRHGSDGSPVMSDEESVKSQRIESITDDDSDSDDDSDISDTPFEESLTELAKKSKQYFWQYNIQAKGPKGTRLQLTINDNDPHHPSHFEDPVFDPTNTSLVGIRHGGKARKGDGNEISPNPRKLYMIGQKLCKLNREINNVQLASDLPANVRSKSRKEKNKLSSRACRLKKKAQHEANKIKLFGLNREQGELLDVVQVIWAKLKEGAKHQMKENIPFSSNTLAVHIDNIIKEHCKTRIAGNTAEYVNKAVAKVEDGDPAGGLPIRVKVK